MISHFVRIENLVSWWAVVESAGSLDGLLLRNSDDGDWYGIETKALEEILCIGIDFELSGLGLAEVEGRNFGDVLIFSLTLLFLELEGNTTNRTTLNTLHQMGSITGNLVAETLRGNDGDLIADSLVGLEIEGQLGVVSLNDDLGGFLDGLGTNATHDCGLS